MPSDAASIDRRTLLMAGGAALALVIAGGAGCSGDDGDQAARPDPAAEPVEVPAFGAVHPGVIAVGRAYATVHPDATIESLMADLPEPDPDPLTAATARVAGDFSAGATETIDGWVLAESEAKAAGVLFLSCQGETC